MSRGKPVSAPESCASVQRAEWWPLPVLGVASLVTLAWAAYLAWLPLSWLGAALAELTF